MARRARNYYELLGVSPDASREEIHSAYRRLARRYHPDVSAGGDTGTRFHELSDAYEVLCDPAQRARYDRSAAGGGVSVARERESAAGRAAFAAARREPSVARERRSTPARVPFFSAGPRGRDIPRFLDEEARGVGLRFEPWPGMRVQFVVRWLR